MKFGRAFQEELHKLPQDQREQRVFNRRTTAVLAAVAILGSGLYAGLKNGGAGIPRNAPEVAVTVNPGQGADSIIDRVEPQALASPQQRQELDDYINAQGSAANHQLESGQTVHVPIIDPNHK